MSDRFPFISEFFQLGKALKSHGTSGHLRLMIEDRHKTYIRPGTFIFFNINGARVPYKIASLEEGAHIVISLEGIENKKASDQLNGVDFWIPLNEVKSRHQASPRNLRDKWEAYQITDALTGNVFKILRVEEYPQQLMAVVEWESKEILIPLSDQLITHIDKQVKMIHMEVPQGLLDL